MDERKMALHVDEKDNVATIFANGITDGTVVEVRDIIKYGESIGRASADIRKGEYVHIHNLEALRGRGDL